MDTLMPDPVDKNKVAAVVFGVLFGASELLAEIPSIAANSVFQLVTNAFKTLAGL